MSINCVYCGQMNHDGSPACSGCGRTLPPINFDSKSFGGGNPNQSNQQGSPSWGDPTPPQQDSWNAPSWGSSPNDAPSNPPSWGSNQGSSWGQQSQQDQYGGSSWQQPQNPQNDPYGGSGWQQPGQQNWQQPPSNQWQQGSGGYGYDPNQSNYNQYGQTNPQPPGYWQPPGSFGSPYPNTVAEDAKKKATSALICSIIGMLCCPIVSIVGIVMGFQAKSTFDQYMIQDGRGLATAAIVIGFVGLALNILATFVNIMTSF